MLIRYTRKCIKTVDSHVKLILRELYFKKENIKMVSEAKRDKILKRMHEKVHFLRERDNYYNSLGSESKRVFKLCYYITILKAARDNFKLKHNLRTRISHALKRKTKSGSAIKDLGCTIEQFREYLESKFYDSPYTGEKMTWDNYGLYGWHLDHIRPLASVHLSVREDFLKIAHYTNYQPLWATDNLQKRAKY